MQIIWDRNAAINYMAKYAAKCEKTSNKITQLYKDVIGPASQDDNPQTKIRSLMIKSIAGKRDLGQCLISRLLLSEPLYHSSFNYVYLSTDLFTKELNLDKNVPDDAEATKRSIIDFYAYRYNNPRLQNSLENIYNLIDFVRKFTLKKKTI